MSEPDELLSIRSIIQGGGFDNGQKIYFDGKTDKNRVVRITMSADAIGAFIQNLQSFAALAATDRGTTTAGPDEIGPLNAMPIRGLGVHAAADGNTVILRVDQGEGLHVDIPIPIEHIPPFIDALRRRAEQAAEVLKSRGH